MEAAITLRNLLLQQLGRATFETVWRIISDCIDYDATFAPDPVTSQRPLAYSYIRILFTTLAPMMFQLIANEQALNANRSIDEGVA